MPYTNSIPPSSTVCPRTKDRVGRLIFICRLPLVFFLLLLLISFSFGVTFFAHCLRWQRVFVFFCACLAYFTVSNIDVCAIVIKHATAVCCCCCFVVFSFVLLPCHLVLFVCLFEIDFVCPFAITTTMLMA